MALGDGIRRNIASVEPAERTMLREALVQLNSRHFQDEVHQSTHVQGGPEFVPWHPQLSLHYWDWTQGPRSVPGANLGRTLTGNLNLFTTDFMGYGGSTPQEIGEPWRGAGYYVPGATPVELRAPGASR